MTLDAATLARIDAAAERIVARTPPLTAHQRIVIATSFAGNYDRAVVAHERRLMNLAQQVFVDPAPVDGDAA